MFAMLVVALLSTRVAASRPAMLAETPFRLLSQGGIVLDARLNGSGPFEVLLDTGASHSTITESLARTLGAPAVARSVVSSSIGHALRTIVRVDRVELGPASAVVLPTMVGDEVMDQIERVQAIVGQDVLASLRYTIDFPRRRIVWHSSPPASHGTALELDFEEGRFLARLPQERVLLRLVPDSGAGGLVLFDRSLDSDLPVVFERGNFDVATLSGRGPGRRATMHALRVGAATLFNLPAVVVQPVVSVRAGGDGLLPLDLFDVVTMDGPGRLMFVQGRMLGRNP
jgi:predicted aspartyl protease